MDRIELLLEKLDNRIPVSLAKKLDKLDDFEEKLLVAQNEYTEEPTEDNKDALKEITDFVNELKADVISNLEKLLNDRVQKAKEEKERKEQEEKEKSASASTETPPASTDGKPAEEVDKKPEEKKGISVFGVVLGVTLLVATAGAYNYFSKNK